MVATKIIVLVLNLRIFFIHIVNHSQSHNFDIITFLYNALKKQHHSKLLSRIKIHSTTSDIKYL